MSPATLPEVMHARELRTLRAHKDTWQEHAAANRRRIRHETGELWADANTKTGVLIAAGPSLEQSFDELRALDRATHELVCVDMALKPLLAAGIEPDYIICADASEAIADSLAVASPRALLIPLLLNVVVHPDTARHWLGPIYWYAMMSNVFDKDLGAWMQAAHGAAAGVRSFLVPGGNVSSLGLSFLLGVRAAPKVLLYGHDFCWTDDSRFYAGGVAADLAAERISTEKASGTLVAMTDATGKPVWTNASLMHFAGWYADQMQRFPGVIEQRTPTSILRSGGNA